MSSRAAGNAKDLVRKALAHHPDLLVVDIQMPPDLRDDGLRAAREIVAARPATAVLVLSQFLEDRYVIDLLDDRPEGKGYLLKDRIADSDSFVEAVQRVARGGSVIDAEAVGRLVGQRRGHGPIGSLTSREREVLCLMAQGKSNQGIADELVVTVSAVERHVTGIFGRMGLPRDAQDHRRVLAVLQYLRADQADTRAVPWRGFLGSDGPGDRRLSGHRSGLGAGGLEAHHREEQLMPLPARRTETPPRPIQRWDPFREFEQLQEEMGRLMQTVSSPANGDGGAWTPFADIEETDDSWVIEAEVPGVNRDDVNVELRDDELVISGDVKERERRGRLRRRARRTGHFEYHVTLPGAMDEDKIEANLHDGILTVRVPKTEQARPRRIEVKAN